MTVGKSPADVDAESADEDAVAAAVGIALEENADCADRDAAPSPLVDLSEVKSLEDVIHIVETQQETIEALGTELQTERERRLELEERVAELEDEVDHVEDVARTAVGKAQAVEADVEEAEECSRTAMAFGNDLADRLSNLEEEAHVDATEQTVATPAGVDPASSPLDFFANVRSSNLDENLSKNQVRAIKVAKRYDEFAKISHHDGSVAWDRQAITDALTAELGERPFRETVSRVWEKLETLGSDDVEQTRRNNGQTTGTGTKVLRMDRDVAEGLQEARYVQFDLLEEASPNGGGGVMPVVTG